MKNHKWLLKILNHQKMTFLLAFFLLALEAITTIMQPKIITNIFDIAIVIKDKNYLLFNIFFYFLLEVVSLGGTFVTNYIFCFMVTKVFYEIKMMICDKVFDFDGPEISSKVSMVITCLTNDVNNLETIFSKLVPQIAVGAIQFCLSIYIIWNISSIIIIVVVLMYPFMIFFQRNFNTLNQNIVNSLMKNYDSSNQLIKELTTNLYEYIVYRAKTYFVGRFSKIQKTIKEETLHMKAVQEYNLLFINGMSSLFMITVISIGGYLVMKEQITNGDLIVLMLYIGRLFTPVTRTFVLASQIPKCKISIHRIENLIGKDEENVSLEI